MTQATPRLKLLAGHLLRTESMGLRPARAGGSAAGRVCARLQVVLTPLIGAAGFEALLVRALMLAKTDTPEWQDVVVAEGVLQRVPVPSRAPFGRGDVVLVAQVVGLMITFVGEQLTIQLVHGVWPKAHLGRWPT